MMPGAFVITSAALASSRAARDRSPAATGRLGRGEKQPDRLVAGMAAPGHGRAEVQGLGGFGGCGGACRLARTAPGTHVNFPRV